LALVSRPAEARERPKMAVEVAPVQDAVARVRGAPPAKLSAVRA
jgi:hypothetical protein